MSLVEDGVLGIARDEQHGQSGTPFARDVRKLAAIHAMRKSDISQQEIDLVFRF
jgi:hypothetical protein